MTVVESQSRLAKIGFVGLGNMGGPMAVNLRRHGFDLVGYDLDPAAVRRLSESHGCSVAGSRRALTEASDILVFMLPDGKAVRDFLYEDHGADLAAGRFLRPGAIVVDMSSSSPMGTRSLGQVLREQGAALIDAPVSGGVPRAVDGTLAIMVGGDETVADGLADMFGALGTAMYVGPLGSGHAMKALNNYVSAAGLVAACEAVKVAEKFGVSGEIAVRVLNSSTGKNNSTEKKLMQHVISQRFDSGFSIGLMRKDLNNAMDLARAVGIQPPLGRDLLAAWTLAEKRFGKSGDHTKIAEIIEDSSAQEALQPLGVG